MWGRSLAKLVCLFTSEISTDLWTLAQLVSCRHPHGEGVGGNPQGREQIRMHASSGQVGTERGPLSSPIG